MLYVIFLYKLKAQDLQKAMNYQITIYSGDLLGLNDLLKTMQEIDLSEIVDVVQLTENNYMIKYKKKTLSFWANWFNI